MRAETKFSLRGAKGNQSVATQECYWNHPPNQQRAEEMTGLNGIGSATVATLLSALVVVNVWKIGAGHSFLVQPRGDFKSFKKAECRLGGPPHEPNDKCAGPCLSTDSWQYDKKTSVRQYSRGQRVSMVWTRNNHEGGFVRFSLVPKHLRMDKKAHEKMSFRYACFESDKHKCKTGKCGTDVWLYKTDVIIPTSYPDGEYVLSWAWYGGLSSKKSYFGDYYSCSPVKIQGGPLTPSYNPYFNPGENVKYRSSCEAAVDRIGMCAREPCTGYQGRKMKPFPFSQNRTPKPILSSWMTKKTMGRSDISPAPSPTPSRTPSPSTKSPTPSQTPKHPKKSSNPSLTQKPPTKNPTPSRPPKNPKQSGPPAVDGNTTIQEKVVQVIGLKLIDIDAKLVISKILSNSQRIRLHGAKKSFTLVAKTRGDVKSVSFYVNDKYLRTERVKPYSLWGDIEGKYRPWPNPKFNTWIRIKVVASGRSGTRSHKKFRILLTRVR